MHRTGAAAHGKAAWIKRHGRGIRCRGVDAASQRAWPS
ncbi:MAG: hypothetical protein OJF55_000440 [Rhodanobacteraceae bacterium]|nr:MAG: hypothetical protein OJF55_000440 [Rhodanobacteraceae bacterium]